MNSVSLNTDIKHVPAVAKANRLNRSVGFGIMGHHGFIAENYILYGSEENLDLIDVFFNMINFYSLQHSMLKLKKPVKNSTVLNIQNMQMVLTLMVVGQILPKTDKVKEIFKNIYIPTDDDWLQLKEDVMTYGLYNSHRLAVAPNGSIGYIMSATPSLTPINNLLKKELMVTQRHTTQCCS